ncbi:hypothetical protein CDD80_1938 [Ophiocordyceps camponoti-rufipedis]|uniref:Uncharacterized protein n=1 Tax=Ophiocordyceps camponoti-rufipedis TaxID=2004952 RepID=A0A2C5Z8B8_9HYPO|nr:hypothetical protein CDD80_1938 [Ophiocordyceps camponoti-rufipedis]
MTDLGSGFVRVLAGVASIRQSRLVMPRAFLDDVYLATSAPESTAAVPNKSASAGEFGSSSTLLDPACSSTLRSRLRSQDPGPRPLAVLESDYGAEVFRRFRACFSMDPVPTAVPQTKGAKSPATAETGVMAQLGETFAEAGLHFYTAVAEEIVSARRDMDSQIETLSRESTDLLSRADTLYSNVAYPLSATLCHFDKTPSATIATHLSEIRAKLTTAQGELEALQREWESCVEDERQTWTELMDMDAKKAKAAQNGGSDGVMCAVDGFKEEAEAIIEAHEEELDEIDTEFRELMQTETMKMMQSMMAS